MVKKNWPDQGWEAPWPLANKTESIQTGCHRQCRRRRRWRRREGRRQQSCLRQRRSGCGDKSIFADLSFSKAKKTQIELHICRARWPNMSKCHMVGWDFKRSSQPLLLLLPLLWSNFVDLSVQVECTYAVSQSEDGFGR